MNNHCNPKRALIDLVSALSERSGKTFNQIRWEINHYVGYELTRSMFDNYFRQKAELYTRYPDTVILALIYCFREGIPPHKRITPLEAFLLINWSNSSLNVIRKIIIFFDKELFEASLEVFIFELDQDIEWIDETIKQVEMQVQLRYAKRKDETSSNGRLSADLLPMQDLIQRLEILLKELKK